MLRRSRQRSKHPRDHLDGRPRRPWLRAAIAAASLTAIATVAWSVGASHDAGPPDFAMIAYQGQDVLGGDEVRFRDVVGQGVTVILNFWAASCPPCRAEMPGFQEVADAYGDAIVLLGVDVGAFTFLGTHEQARAFLGEYDITYPAAYAVDGQVLRDYEVRGMPTTLFFDASGKQVAKHTGFLPGPDLRERIEDLLAEGG